MADLWGVMNAVSPDSMPVEQRFKYVHIAPSAFQNLRNNVKDAIISTLEPTFEHFGDASCRLIFGNM